MSIKNFLKNKKGDSGIGTLIVFIAMVLVAAVAASVLINTSGFLQQKASTTGKESTEQVASGLQVQSITGKVGTSDLKYLAVYVTPNAGSAAIDLAEAKMFLTYDGKSQILIYNQTNANKTQDLTAGAADVFGAGIVGNTSANQMVVAVLQDYDNSVVDNGVINKGDMVALVIDANAAFSGEIPERSVISGKVQPEFGAPGIIEFTTPATFTTSLVELQ